MRYLAHGKSPTLPLSGDSSDALLSHGWMEKKGRPTGLGTEMSTNAQMVFQGNKRSKFKMD